MTSPAESYDVAVLGAGPAGLSAALNLVRARRTTILLDGNRPRNAATFHSHGFITRDGVAPLELRRLARQELEEYPNYAFHQTTVRTVERAEGGFTVSTKGPGLSTAVLFARTVVIATGITEIMPALPTLRAFYGTSIHSCIECDGWDEQGKPTAIIGETGDLVERALLASQWSDDIIVFTNGVGTVEAADDAMLAARGIRVDRRPLIDVAGDQTGLTGILVADGTTVPRTAAYVRPGYRANLEFVAGLGLAVDDSGFLVVDAEGRTSGDRVYACGDSAAPGPRQLIVAAGQGARAASAVNRDLIGISVT